MATTYTPIATTTLSSAVSSVDFTSIPSTYTDLVIIMQAKHSATNTGVAMGYNSDTGTNYSLTAISGNGTSASSFRNTSVSPANIADIDNSNFNAVVINVMNYANSTTYKTAISKSAAPSTYVTSYCSLWRNTAAITKVTLSVAGGNFVSGSTFTLYGIKAA